MLCAICNALNAADLLKRVEADLQLNAQYPAENGLFVFSYRDHHGSFDALEASAAAGCELCQLIAREYKETKIHWAYFKGQTRVSVIREGEQLGRRISLGVRLDSEHLDISSSGVEACSMFDLLVFATFPGQFLDFEPVIFTLEKLREDSTSIGPHTIGRYRLDPELGSKLNYDIASSWLHKCCNTHSKCPDGSNVPLPSRLVAVGTETKGPRLVLTEGQTGRYTALSHCWGGDVPLKTTTKTIETFKESINLDNLPLNFRDSIYITREIGLEYIWIDSLCIIQDSKSDWEIQSENMGEIYARSLFTLSATASPNVSHGILKTAVEYRPFKEQVFLKLYSRPSAGSVAIKCRDGEAETTNTLLNYAALSKRGWCLQENILPSRVLHYGKQQLYWQCQHGLQSADGIPEGKTTWSVSTYYEIQSYIHKSDSSDEKAKPTFLSVKKCRENYLALISSYSDRQLTNDNDKFPAFGGLAAKFGEVFEGKYIAGIWTSFWRECLLWYKDISTAKHCVPYRAPSWSWAVTNENILWAATSEAPMASSAYDAILLPNQEVKLENEGSKNIYGQVAFAKIEISALTFPL
ncbi:heterokaryon incompatibility protein-domain-containing protein, partial [Bisporella sp. PMI_857]